MKKIMFFLLSVILMVGTYSCIDYSTENADCYDYLTVNAKKIATGDTITVAVNDYVLLEIFDANQTRLNGTFYSSNLSAPFGTGKLGSITYSNTGIYKITVTTSDVAREFLVYIKVVTSTDYTLKINGNSITNGSTFKATTVQSLMFKVVDANGKVITTNFDFGNGSKIKADSTSLYYADAGTYKFTANSNGRVILITIEVTKATTDAIVLISSSISGGTINATLGLRCSTIPNFSSSKITYVAGEYTGFGWNKYIVSDVANIGGIDYFKWSVNVIGGSRFRLSWIQLKDGQTSFSYDGCNWSYDTSSIFWGASDYLYYFYLRIVNNTVVLSANAN